jgi:hypothetical protein
VCADDSSEEASLNPDAPFLPSSASFLEPHEKSDEDEEDADSASTDSLTPYDLNDDLSDVNSVRTPRYLRECLISLSSEEPDVLEATLRTLPTLIRQRPDELGT